MDDLEKRQSEMLVRLNSFRENNKVILNSNAKAAAACIVIAEVVSQLEEIGALRSSADESKITSSAKRKTMRKTLNSDVTEISRTAKQLERDEPDFVNRFRLPSKTMNDQMLLETARAFANDLPVAAQYFLDLHVPDDFIDKLIADTEVFAASIVAQDVSKRERVGANASIDNIISKALKARRTLDTIVPNLFRDNPGKLAQWTAAKTIQKAAKVSKPDEK